MYKSPSVMLHSLKDRWQHSEPMIGPYIFGQYE